MTHLSPISILRARRLKNAARAVDLTAKANAQTTVLNFDAPPQKSARPGDDFWEELERTRAGKLGSRVQSKRQYLGFVEDLLHTGTHIPAWAVAYAKNGFISSYELIETVARVRKVDAVYSKDFSDLLGVRASIITAGV